MRRFPGWPKIALMGVSAPQVSCDFFGARPVVVRRVVVARTRRLTPDVYFRKGAKWVRSLTLTLTPSSEPGFGATCGYHNHGDPWFEQRCQGV